MAKSLTKSEHPALIIMICILGVVGVILTVNSIITSTADMYGNWFLPYSIASAVLQAVFIAGIWMMRKWGANGYIVFSILNVALLAFIGAEFVFQLIIAGVVIFVLFGYYNRMR
jgi:hypothetical protein